MKTEVTDSVVSEFAKRVRRGLGSKVHAVYWFGSRARGEGSSDSDYDLLLESASPLSIQERDFVTDISVDISGRNRVLLDVHYDLCEKMHGLKRFITPFRDVVMSEGIVL
jgi:predicted nucleotidyltransferase